MSEPLFRTDPACAAELDAHDALAEFRREFHVPRTRSGQPFRYFVGNSLGLQPKATAAILEEELAAWRNLAVEAHFAAQRPWYSYHEQVRASLARLVGARDVEVVAMNSLTVNLHLLLVSFFRPQGPRHRILVDDPMFPSDLYTIQTQLAHHGLDPAASMVRVGPGAGEHTVSEDAIEAAIAEHADELALVFLGGVNFLTGQRFDLPRLARAAHAAGALLGVDLAHAAGNVILQLHDWDVDFAAWCSYKYLNSGPGAVAGAFVHERHAHNIDLPRFGGWWGNDPETRFRMHLEERFVPQPSADGWQLSNPPILALAPLRTSLDVFDAATMPALRGKSERLTGYFEYLLRELGPSEVSVLTPADPESRGCQLSLRIPGDARSAYRALESQGILCDVRPPDILRFAPVPLYNTFVEVMETVQALRSLDFERLQGDAVEGTGEVTE